MGGAGETDFPQICLGPQSSSRKIWEGASPEGPWRPGGRSGWACARPLPHARAARGREADDSPCRLIAALSNFAPAPGEAGLAAAREPGCALVQGRRENTPPSPPPTERALPWTAPPSRARRFTRFACSVSVGAQRAGAPSQEAPRVWTKPSPRREAARVQGPLAHLSRKPSAQRICEGPRAALRVCGGRTRTAGARGGAGCAVFLAGPADFRTAAAPLRSVLRVRDDFPEQWA